jgi:hypothetical protein
MVESGISQDGKRQLKVAPSKAIPCVSGPSAEEQHRALAALAISPSLSAQRVIEASQPPGIREELDTPSVLKELVDQARKLGEGDTSQPEAMLINQAVALQSLFAGLTERALVQSMSPHFHELMRLGLKAQNQCRSTLQALGALKAPPSIYAKQANVTTGPQQVNNG